MTMLCIVDTPVDLANWVELNNLLNARKGRGDGQRSASALPWADFSKMKSDEKLYLLAHGAPNEIGENQKYSAQALAAVLLKKGMPQIAKIILVACESGVSENSNPAFCAVLAKQIDQQSKGKVKVPVTGFTGSAVTDQLGRTRAVDETKSQKRSVQYDDIMDRWAAKRGEWENEAAHSPWKTQEDLIASAKTRAAKSQPFFAELYDINAHIVKDREDSKLKVPAVGASKPPLLRRKTI
jgi:hypothetical protein